MHTSGEPKPEADELYREGVSEHTLLHGCDSSQAEGALAKAAADIRGKPQGKPKLVSDKPADINYTLFIPDPRLIYDPTQSCHIPGAAFRRFVEAGRR